MKTAIFGLTFLFVILFFSVFFDKITGFFAKEELIEEKDMFQKISERLCGANPENLPNLLVLLNDTENIRRLNINLPKFVMLDEVFLINLAYTSKTNWCNLKKEEIIENYGIFVLQTNYMLFRSDMDEKSAFGYAIIDLFDKVLIGADTDKRKELAVELAKIGYLKSMDDYIGFLSETLGSQLGELLFNEYSKDEKNTMANVLIMAIGYLK